VGQNGSGDVYAGKDGNAYKKTENGWQQYENGGWNPVDTSGAKANAQAKAQSAQAGQTSTTSAGAQRDRASTTTGASPQTGGQRASPMQSNELQTLDRDAKARQQGTERTQKYQRQSRSGEGRSRTRTRRN
jgi:hypothetical protein